jgi:hypothetical protein
MKNIDFPAGHSMDTDWFAVDKDGNIAFFDTGSEGNLPSQIPQETIVDEFFKNYAIPITPGLKQLFLNEKTIGKILEKCNPEILNKILEDEFAIDGGVFLLNEGKTWEDLDFEIDFAEEEYKFALLLSQKIPLFLLSETYNIRDKLIEAIKNNIISKAYGFYHFVEDEMFSYKIGVKDLEDLGAYTYDHNEYDCTEP